MVADFLLVPHATWWLTQVVSLYSPSAAFICPLSNFFLVIVSTFHSVLSFMDISILAALSAIVCLATESCFLYSHNSIA